MNNAEAIAKQWQQNVTAKIGEVRNAINAFFAIATEAPDNQNRKQALEQANLQVQGLIGLYGQQHLPQHVRDIHGQLQHFASNPTSAKHAGSMFQILGRLHEILVADDSKGLFDSAFDQYKNDRDLTALVDQLIEALGKVAQDGDEHFNAAQVRDLESIIAQLKRRSHYSLNELFTWIEAAGALVLRLIGITTGVSALGELANTLGDAKKLIDQSSNRLRECHQQATQETLTKAGMTYSVKHLGNEQASISMRDEPATPLVDTQA